MIPDFIKAGIQMQALWMIMTSIWKRMMMHFHWQLKTISSLMIQ